jgi:hypothetical protein
MPQELFPSPDILRRLETLREAARAVDYVSAPLPELPSGHTHERARVARQWAEKIRGLGMALRACGLGDQLHQIRAHRGGLVFDVLRAAMSSEPNAWRELCRLLENLLGISPVHFDETADVMRSTVEELIARLVAPVVEGRDPRAARREPGKRKRTGGRPRLEKSNPLKFHVYERIRQEYQPGEEHVDMVSRLKADKDFFDQVKTAGLRPNTQLVRTALAFFEQRERDKARKKQETDSN